jgi:hypothetical protein
VRFRYLSQPEAFAAALNRSRETGYRYGVRKSAHDNQTTRAWGPWVVYRIPRQGYGAL